MSARPAKSWAIPAILSTATWLEYYNRERAHIGRYCYGKTPLQTFRDSKHLADQKRLDKLLETTATRSQAVTTPLVS
ncbi:MAG: hypothetical protein HXX08_17025 [Chloroflexi bacterium]|uniref:Integrase catalytic domain-containing protein n=1 Tax=Candidatus Chlorohelix allophototropha TaxID=3003348 RepID=A0A8T7M6G2_9CHLR|nr:hypothetical protein [Chloroflexota bacterium]